MFTFKDEIKEPIKEVQLVEQFNRISEKFTDSTFMNITTCFGRISFDEGLILVNGNALLKAENGEAKYIETLVGYLKKYLDDKASWELTDDIVAHFEGDVVIPLYVPEKLQENILLFKPYPLDSLAGAICSKSKKYQIFDNWLICFDEEMAKKSPYLNGKFYTKLEFGYFDNGGHYSELEYNMAIHNAGNKMFYIQYKTEFIVLRYPSGESKEVKLSNDRILVINDPNENYVKYDDTKLILPEIDKDLATGLYDYKVKWLENEKNIDEINQALRDYVQELINKENAHIEAKKQIIDYYDGFLK